MRKALISLNYQHLIYEAPVSAGTLYQNACANDKPTIEHWRHAWLGNTSANKQKFGSFADNSVASLYQKHQYMPIIIAGSGPSLKVNAHELKNRKGIPLVSCLHNFHYFEDLGLAPEYYVSLDAGDITVREVYTGGEKTPEEYWAMSKERTLICYVGTHPELLAKWQGKVIFFNAPVPDDSFMKQMDAIEPFTSYVSSGGNVLGACLYLAKAVMGGAQIIFVGADLSFGYDEKFYAWKDPFYDTPGNTMVAYDIYGIPVKTWPSYYGFKQYFDSVTMRVPGVWYNCTEGGILGSYREGNLANFKYMDLKDCLNTLNCNEGIKEQMTDPKAGLRLLLYS